MSKTPLKLSSAVGGAPSEAEQRTMGKQLTEQFHKAELAQLDFVTFGAMCVEIEAAISATRGTDAKRLGGKDAKGEGLKGWLAKFAPDVSYGTARRYRDIAEALVGELHLKGAEQLKLIAGDEKKLDGKLAKKREKLVDFVADKSVRGLQSELGLRDETPRSTGSKTRPPVETMSAAQRRAAFVEAARENALAAFDRVHRIDDRWKLLTDDQIKLAQKECAALAKAMESWLNTPAANRAALQLEKFIGEATEADNAAA